MSGGFQSGISKSRGRMDSEGQKVSNPSAMLAGLVSKRKKLQEELRNIENQVYELETSYLQDSNQCGSVLKGFEGFLSSSKSTINLKRSRKFQPEDRLFSLSSVTSPAVEEHIAGREGKPDSILKNKMKMDFWSINYTSIFILVYKSTTCSIWFLN
ncbi:Chromatin modification-related protein Eaf6 protein [Dioscorea alata]|uniref:Chromatin modification-related protein Eaf6 protein n=1 Tax=Dioscorea alata TaxID=55571 RepID=A0ACB7UEX7_DIOAL|nr:Chromatin modification-related protein Eaf6 protein [Dioscorea alata]